MTRRNNWLFFKYYLSRGRVMTKQLKPEKEIDENKINNIKNNFILN